MASIEEGPSDFLAEPDIMNDPAYETNQASKEKSMDEPDTCRICRGEGSKEEPLFYPCKCSGSIKFVHQACLMEWLSHSQKKHCELCKTSFRFTKLYDPHMPKTVPLPVFFRQAAIHTLKSVITWTRWHLVAFVWLGWVPWCMRTVWRGLFWIGDGGWADWKELEKRSSLVRMAQLELEKHGLQQVVLDRLSNGASTPVGPALLPSDGAAASNVRSKISAALPSVLLPVSQTLNFTVGEPTLFKLAKRMARGLLYYHSIDNISQNSTSPNTTSFLGSSGRSPSWLSELTFLRNLTRWRTMNNIIVDVLEGQLITLCVCITFILIFLIREWVVQQQPGINMGVALNMVPAVDVPVPRPEAPQVPAQVENQAEPVIQNQDAAEGPNDGTYQPGSTAQHDARPHRHGSAAPFSTFSTLDQNSRAASIGDATSTDIDSSITGPSSNDSRPGSSNTIQRPGMPARETIARATEIRRTLDEQSRASGADWPGREKFMDLWTRSGANPSEVLRIISEEGREEELAWIVSRMKKLEAATAKNRVAQAVAPELEEGSSGENSDASNESWQVIGGLSDQSLISVATAKPPQARHEAEETPSGQMPPIDNLSEEVIPDFNSALGKGKGRQEYPEHEQTQAGAATGQSNSSSKHPFADVPAHDIDEDNSPDYADYENGDGGVKGNLDDFDGPLEDRNGRIYDVSSTGEASSLPSTDSTESAQNEMPETLDRPQVPGPINPPGNIRENVLDWLWGGVNQIGAEVEDGGADDERVVEEIVEEPPFVPLVQNQLVIADVNLAENPVPDPEVLRAAIEAGVNPNEVEVIEDGEDLEGIMELIGMQGPLAALVQNGMFCAVLISMTVFFGIWLPYIAGKLFLIFLANPISLLVKMPLRWASIFADLVIDTCVLGAACAFYWVDTVIRYACAPVGWFVPYIARMNQQTFVGATAKHYAGSALERLAKMSVATGDILSDSDIPVFSIIAHESLLNIENRFVNTTNGVMDMTIRLSQTLSSDNLDSGLILKNMLGAIVTTIQSVVTSVVFVTKAAAASVPAILNINPLRMSLEIPQRTQPLDYSLAEWSTKDRVFAVALGYLAFSIAGAIYVKMRIAFRDRSNGDKFEGPIADALFQAGGVMKVILIISIEMIAFPLYCGMLLDIALLPLFENASLVSRLRFTLNSPATSLFIHWFVGTCYMFHFALFVSMCRKIMRKGVLYFIRDPDDPTFHPVRDVLERNVSTQLRKIAFSALVYGALVIICLGTVVWGLSFAADGVFPIHWSSNEPILEFPVDLLFYNFLMPLVVKLFRPSKGLRVMYGWWFRRCARALRLTEFLFGEEKKDEQGHWAYHNWWRSIVSKQEDPTTPTAGSGDADGNPDVNFIRDGLYVRAPASDQVRIPKGARTFVVVDEDNKRIDGIPDTDQGLHGSKNPMFAKLYIPPSFYIRISTFIFLIWLFAATTGVGLTIVPLKFGRFIFAHLIPPHLRMNDIYAFSIGIYLLGGPLYLAIRYRSTFAEGFQRVHSRFSPSSGLRATSPQTDLSVLLRTTASYTLQTARLFYIYTAFTLLLPSLFAILMELYLIIPLHTYFSTTSTATSQSLSGGQGNALTDRHTIHFIQDWTLGVLYIKMGARLILWNRDSRPARALRAITAPPFGWLNPDVRLATRAFILPATLFMIIAITAPLGLGYIANNLFFDGQDALVRACVYRYSYPGLLSIGLASVFAMKVKKAVSGWRTRVRDEVYLIGERLHNFGERRDAISVGRDPNDTSPMRRVRTDGTGLTAEERAAIIEALPPASAL